MVRYTEDERNAINEGGLAEAWVMHHRVVKRRWENDRYVMVVTPQPQGMQVVQFARHEAEAELPLEVITPQGVAIEHRSGDW